jgi:hypothetical protein
MLVESNLPRKLMLLLLVMLLVFAIELLAAVAALPGRLLQRNRPATYRGLKELI